MPHDRKGRLIEVGDFIKAPSHLTPKQQSVGVVHCIRDGQACSGDAVFPTVFQGPISHYFDADKVEIVLKANGSDPAEPISPTS